MHQGENCISFNQKGITWRQNSQLSQIQQKCCVMSLLLCLPRSDYSCKTDKEHHTWRSRGTPHRKWQNPWKSLFQNVVSAETTNQLRTMIMNSSHRGFKQALKSYCSISLDPLSLWLLLWLILVECKLREEGRNFVLSQPWWLYQGGWIKGGWWNKICLTVICWQVYAAY